MFGYMEHKHDSAMRGAGWHLLDAAAWAEKRTRLIATLECDGVKCGSVPEAVGLAHYVDDLLDCYSTDPLGEAKVSPLNPGEGVRRILALRARQVEEQHSAARSQYEGTKEAQTRIRRADGLKRAGKQSWSHIEDETLRKQAKWKHASANARARKKLATAATALTLAPTQEGYRAYLDANSIDACRVKVDALLAVPGSSTAQLRKARNELIEALSVLTWAGCDLGRKPSIGEFAKYLTAAKGSKVERRRAQQLIGYIGVLVTK